MSIVPQFPQERANEVLRAKDKFYSQHPEHLAIYIAAPLSASHTSQARANVFEAYRAGLEVLKRGHTPIIPHWLHDFEQYTSKIHGVALHYETSMALVDVLLLRSDAFLYHASSPGADREYLRAKDLGKTMYYSLEEVPIVTPSFVPVVPVRD